MALGWECADPDVPISPTLRSEVVRPPGRGMAPCLAGQDGCVVRDERSWRRRLDDAAGSPMVRRSVKYELPLWIFLCALVAAGLLADGNLLIGLLVVGLGVGAAFAFVLLLRR